MSWEVRLTGWSSNSGTHRNSWVPCSFLLAWASAEWMCFLTLREIHHIILPHYHSHIFSIKNSVPSFWFVLQKGAHLFSPAPPLLWSHLPAEHLRVLPCRFSPHLYSLLGAVIRGPCRAISCVSLNIARDLCAGTSPTVSLKTRATFIHLVQCSSDTANVWKGASQHTWTLGMLARFQNCDAKSMLIWLF